MSDMLTLGIAFLTGFFTLLAGYLASPHSRSLQRAQLDHDSREKALYREHETKRDVYLNLMSACAELVSELSNVQNQEVDHAAFPRILSKFGIATSKAQLVASAKTHKLITDSVLNLNQCIQELSPHYFKFIGLKVAIKNEQLLSDKITTESNSIISQMRMINVKDPPNRDAMIQELSRQYNDDEELRKEISERLSEKNRELYECQLNWAKGLSKNQANASQNFRLLVLSIRDELGLENSDEFVGQLSDSARASMQAMDGLIVALDKLVQDSFKEADSGVQAGPRATIEVRGPA